MTCIPARIIVGGRPRMGAACLLVRFAKRCEQVIRQTAEKYRSEIIAKEIMPDHVPVLVEVDPQHVTDDAVLIEVMIRGTHLGKWRDLPATGRRVEFPLCGVYTFDADDRLAGEKIYSDRGKQVWPPWGNSMPTVPCGHRFSWMTYLGGQGRL